MKRIAWLLIPLLWLLAACGSGGADSFEQPAAEAPGQESGTAEVEPTMTLAPAAVEEAEPTAASDDDPTQARERDWKLGALEEPAVTVIEYGDFQ